MTTEDVGNAAAFLLSDLAAAITGEIIYVDAGFSHVVGGIAATSSPSDSRPDLDVRAAAQAFDEGLVLRVAIKTGSTHRGLRIGSLAGSSTTLETRSSM